MPAAVEEILRTTGKGGGGIPRYAHENVQIGGVDIAGELVIFDIGAANHDPAAFAEPDRFDPRPRHPQTSRLRAWTALLHRRPAGTH